MIQRSARSVDAATLQMIEVADQAGIQTAWERLESQEPQCGFGKLGICCKNCFMGPCRIDPFGDGAQAGICGATADIIVVRNLLRHICSGTAAHSDHARDLVHALLLAAAGTSEAYKIRGPGKLRKMAAEYGIPHEGRTDADVAKEVGEFLLAEFGRQEGVLANIRRAPDQQQKNWTAEGATPRGVDREVVTGIHVTHVGGDNDAEHILMAAARTALADGWGGSMIATDVSDILFGEPHPLKLRVNLGVLKADEVNIIVHGHEPTLSDVIVAAVRDPQLLAEAREKGANQPRRHLLHGQRDSDAPWRTDRRQLLATGTGRYDGRRRRDAGRCPMRFSGLDAAGRLLPHQGGLHEPQGPLLGAVHVEFHEEEAMEIAKKIVRIAIENYPHRDPAKVNIPKEEEPLVAGFTTEVVFQILGGRYRPSYRPLNDAIQTGRVRGVAGVVGCNNPKQVHDAAHLAMVRELIRNDVLVVQTGCHAIACGKAGLLAPEAAASFAGKGLDEICRAVGIPPVLHVGSCVDNSRILTACIEMVREGGIGDSLDKLPVAGAAPEWMSEKAIAIGMYFVASGIFVVIGQPLPVEGSRHVVDLLTRKFDKPFGATWAFELDPIKAAHLMIDHIDRKRADLGLPLPMYPVPYVPKTADAVVAAG